MYRTILDFSHDYSVLIENTQKVFNALTQESLDQAVAEGHRNIRRLAWHIVTTIPEMMNRMGLNIEAVKEDAPVPETLEEIKRDYSAASSELLELIKTNWHDATLLNEDDMYGYKWKRGRTLQIFVQHEVHHRGQMTILMRQAGLSVPGTFGPSKEEWIGYGMEEPQI